MLRRAGREDSIPGGDVLVRLRGGRHMRERQPCKD